MRLRTLCKIAQKIATAFVLALGLAWQAYADTEGNAYAGDNIYAGTLGKSAIIVHFYKNNDGKSVGTYFYRSKGRDIGLANPSKEGQYMECPIKTTGESVSDPEDPEPCDDPRGYWRLSMTDDGAAGEWSKTADFNKPLAIHLKRVSNLKTCDDQDNAYECLRMEGTVSVRKGSQGQSDDGTVAWHFVQEKRSQVSVPQLTKAPNATAMRAVNNIIKQKSREYISRVLTGMTEDSPPEYEVVLANKRTITVENSYVFQHPLYGSYRKEWNSDTFDLGSGEKIEWKRLLRFPEENKKSIDYAKETDVVSMALRKAIAQQDNDECFADILDRFNQLNQNGNSYSYAMNQIEFSPHKDGLFVVLLLWDISSPYCAGTGVTIPWTEVRPLLLKPFPLP